MTKAVLALVLAANAAAFQSSMPSESPKKREVGLIFPGTSIDELVRPDDEIVVLQLTGDVPIATGRPSIQQVVTHIRREADLVVVAEVVGTTAHENKARSWIETQMDVYVDQFIIKSQRLNDLSSSRKQRLNVPGGELFIGNALVKTEGMFSFKIGGVYLLFLAKPLNGAPFLRWVYPPFLVEGSRLVRNRSDFNQGYDQRYLDPLGGQALSTVVGLLRKP